MGCRSCLDFADFDWLWDCSFIIVVDVLLCLFDAGVLVWWFSCYLCLFVLVDVVLLLRLSCCLLIDCVCCLLI